MEIDALLLSRFQFAWVIALHILLPAFTVGLSCFIATLEVLRWATGRDVYARLSTFWLRIFAVSFGMGVVSGIVMPFQFGTNWSRFVAATSNVVGGFMAYEVLTAFFLESAFLGVLLFGRSRVPQWAHALSAVMVALGTLLSSFWILAVNSWMQTPTGYRLVDGRFYPDSLLSVLLSPSFPYRLAHTVTAFLVTTAFVVLGVGAHYLLQRRAPDESRVMVKMALLFLAIMVPVQIVLGDAHGLNTLEHQPTKLAAMEGLWDTGRGVPATLFALPDEASETNRFEVSIPKLGSLYLTHDWNGLVHGLKDWPRDRRPPVAVVFFAFHLMVGLGVVMLAIIVRGLTLLRGGRLYERRGWLGACRAAIPIGFVAVLAGWTTTEAGRQPWTVYGLMRTADSVTPSLTTADVALSLALYVVSYIVIFGSGFVLLRRLVRIGPSAPVRAHAAAPRNRRRTMTGLDLVPLWAGVLALSVLMYVLLDGFDLGVGMLFFWRTDEAERDVMIASVSPVWDFNETWLVLGGTLLLAAFPGAFSVVVPGVYFPVLLMLLGLLFRGVAFEFRGVTGARKRLWSGAFAYGSLVATAAQGAVLGMFVQGFKVVDGRFAGTSWDWVAPFPLLTAAGLVAGYLLLGSTWLVMKGEGPLRAAAQRSARHALVGVIVFIVVVSVWTPLADRGIAARWFAWPNLLVFSPVPVLTAWLAWLAARALRRGRDVLPFVASIGLFFLGFSGLTISLWPHVAPPSVTLWSAASAQVSQEFLMIGTAFMLPVLLLYVCWSYWVFRGKVRGDVGYEHM